MYIKKKINITKEDVFIFNYYCYWIIEKLCIFFFNVPKFNAWKTKKYRLLFTIATTTITSSLQGCIA